jgi:3-methyladenine DNA glycosylase AlkC
MSTLLKDLYSPLFYDRFADIVKEVLPSLDKERFIKAIFNEAFPAMELKQRMKHTAKVLHQFLPADFGKAASVIEQLITQLRKHNITKYSLEFMFLPDYIETYGLNDFDHAVKAIEVVTQYTSCEFAVRPFLIKYGDRMMQQMTAWSLHDNDKVRRLASEGMRPRLPWAIAVPLLKKEPSLILPILENLKDDSSEFVRRSVANNLNDIAKDHPEVVIQIANHWKGRNKETDAIIKHGCRTLLKQGHQAILQHYGLQSEGISLDQFLIKTPTVKVGSTLDFSFSFINTTNIPQTVRLEYAIHYKRQKGQYSKKVFKISERVYEPNKQIIVKRRQSFKPITTRVFYEGEQRLSIIINGQEKEVQSFRLF